MEATLQQSTAAQTSTPTEKSDGEFVSGKSWRTAIDGRGYFDRVWHCLPNTMIVEGADVVEIGLV